MEFNSLPLEVHLEIFAYLSVREVMKVRRVCKQWNRLTNEVRFKRLSCLQKKIGERLTWHDFNFPSIRSFLDYANVCPKFSQLKYLDASLYPNYDQLEDAFDFLNSFRSLEHVRFSCSIDYPWEIDGEELEKKTFVVNLDNLRKAEFCIYFQPTWRDGNRIEPNWEDSKVSVLLDLPSLLKLTVGSWKNLTLKYPEKLRALCIYGLFTGGPDYSKFTSLSNIYTKGEDLRSISARFIESLPSLRELHLDYGWESNRRSVLPFSKATARIQIFYYGFEISLNQINLEGQQFPSSFYGPNEETTEFIVRNLHQSVDNNSFISGISYNPMARALDDTEMFIVVPQKFPKISDLRIHGDVADANRLLKFINRLQIGHLEFERASLPQWFFEKLAANGSFIRTLWFSTEPTMDILSDHFNFVFKMKNLRSFILDNCSLSLNFVVRLLKEQKSIGQICFNNPGIYWFLMELQDHMWEINLDVYGELVGRNEDERVNAEGDNGEEVDEDKPLYFRHKFSSEEVTELMDTLASRLNTDEGMCPRELLIQLRLHQLQIEEQTGRFWIRKYIYDHTHSICLTLEQMRQFNLLR